MQIRLVKAWGFAWALTKSRLSRHSQGDSVIMSELDELGPRDQELAHRLIKWGHLKFLEHIVVWYNLTATRGFWQDEAAYRIGVSRLSEGTYHATRTPLTQDRFAAPIAEQALNRINQLIKVGDQDQLDLEFPEGYLQPRGVRSSYAVLRRMYHPRRSHRRQEWQTFCDWCESLPYSWLITERTR